MKQMSRQERINMLEKALEFATKKDEPEKAKKIRGLLLRLIKQERDEKKTV